MRHGRKITYLLPMMRSDRFIAFPAVGWLLSGVLFLMVGACAPAAPSTIVRPVHDGQAWQDRARADIGFLDGQDPEGRRTASRGFTRTSTYLAAQMREAGLQPVLSDEYRIQYAATLRRASDVRVQWLGPDTSLAVPGKDHLIVGRPESYSGKGILAELPDPDWLVWNEEILEEHPLSDRWSIEVVVEERVSTAPMHVVGMIPGADPERRDSLVLVLAPVDGSGLQGVASWTDGSDLAIAAASVLAVMRQAAEYQQTWAVYPQTIMVALLSGSRDECQGPDMFFRNFVWDRSMVSRIVVSSMQKETGCDWASLWNRYGPSNPGPEMVVLRAHAPFADSNDSGFGPWRPRVETQDPDVLDMATSEVLRLAREIVTLLP